MLESDVSALLERHRDAFAARDAAALAAQHLPNGTFTSPAAGTVHGREAIGEVYRYWFTAFPDMVFTWEPPIVDGLRAAIFWTLEGTIVGPFFGVAHTGTRVTARGAGLYTFADGGILTVSHIFDFSAVLMKAGVLKARPA